MKPSTRDKTIGKLHEVKGKIREKAGQLTNNPGLQAKAILEEAAGKVRVLLGQMEKAQERP